MCFWLQACGCPNEHYEKHISLIEHSFMDVFLQKNGMLVASTGKCAQTDLWASCLAVSIGFPMTTVQREGIAEWMIEHYDSVISHGQLRHLPAGEFWEQTFVPVPEGTYQNGAYWATPSVWLFDTLCVKDAALAERTLNDLLDYFATYGIFECINGEYRQLDTYVASAVSAYAICKKIK